MRKTNLVLISTIVALFILSGCNGKDSSTSSKVKTETESNQIPITKIEKEDSEVAVVTQESSTEATQELVAEVVEEEVKEENKGEVKAAIAEETAVVVEVDETSKPIPPSKPAPAVSVKLPTPPTPPSVPSVDSDVTTPIEATTSVTVTTVPATETPKEEASESNATKK